MKAIPFFTLGLAGWLMPLAAPAAEPAPPPVWEVQFRLDGGGDAATAALLQGALHAAEVPVPFGPDTVVKLAMSEGGEWFGQARGSFDAAALLDAAAKDGGAWQEAAGMRVLVSGQGGEATAALASPQAGVVIAAAKVDDLDEAIQWAAASQDRGEAWLSGQVDLQRLAKGEPRSRVLRLVHQLSFSLSTAGGETVIQVHGGFGDEASAARAAKILEGTAALLSADPPEGSQPLDERLEVSVQGATLDTKLRLAGEEVATFLKSIQSELSTD